MVLLHKKGSRAVPGNYRPISLVQVDVKVLSKALTFRLHHVISDLIHQDQKGFVKGRSIHHHIRFLSDLQDLVTGRDEEAYAMFLDFEKAFDRVNWDYMFRVLDRMGFGDRFAQWIRLLYTDPQAHLLINQNIQPALFPTRGVKQGDPLSALLFILTIEPLGNLLRSHEEYGVCLSADHTATGTFFADDSTLLSNSIAHLSAQLDLVRLYCRGSGAKLNLSKSVLFALNRNHDCPLLRGTRVLGRTDTVKYLGIPFGQSSVVDGLVLHLEQRFYDGFKLWYRRARTLRGRLLVAQTMILSRLWHYTQHVFIPRSTVRRWQSMVNRFVLSRQHDRTSSHVQLIPSAFLYQRCCNGGLGIPYLDAHLHRQRLQLLLQFLPGFCNPAVRGWTSASSELLQLMIPPAGQSTALDFLTMSPYRHGTMIRWNLSPAWWKATWKLWFSIKWAETWHDLPPVDRALYGVREPIWYHADSDLHYERSSRTASVPAQRRCLGMAIEPHRSFRLHLSRVFGIRSLSDFCRSGGTWPSQQAFVESHLDFTLQSVVPWRQVLMLRVLYTEATQIVERLGAAGLVFERPTGVRRLLPHLGCASGDKLCLLQAVPKSALLGLVWTPPTPTQAHPLLLHSALPSTDTISSFVTTSRYLRRLLLPVYGDLQFRLAFRLLPVRSRFWFLAPSDPGIRLCVRDDCGAIETERHLFFDCVLAAHLWGQLHRLLAHFFFQRATWMDVVLARRRRLRAPWVSDAGVINDVWHTLRAVTLHFVWSDRNRCLFDGRRPTPGNSAIQVIYACAAAHLRHNLRHRYDASRRSALLRILRVMSSDPAFNCFMTRNPDSLTVRLL